MALKGTIAVHPYLTIDGLSLQLIACMYLICKVLFMIRLNLLWLAVLSQFVVNSPVKIYMKRYDMHNKTVWTTDFFNSCILFIQKSSFIFHTEQNKGCDQLKFNTSAAQGKTKRNDKEKREKRKKRKKYTLKDCI